MYNSNEVIYIKFQAIDRTGERYGRLLVLHRATENIRGKPAWVCACDCGKVLTVPAANLAKGKKSCGCLIKGKPLIMRRSHANKLYNQWSGMIYRCTHEAASHFERYGKRGITVCEEWANSFEAFAEWAISNGYENNLEIDRVNPNGNYCPSNCRWVSHAENTRNRNVRNTCTSGVSGVTFRKDCNSWRVTITKDYKRINIGNFKTFEEAVEARKQAEKKYWGR